MKYIILEIQKSNDGTIAIVPPVSYDTWPLAEQAYHTLLAYAAVSTVDIHSVVMLDDVGTRIKGETYYHGHSPEPEPELESEG